MQCEKSNSRHFIIILKIALPCPHLTGILFSNALPLLGSTVSGEWTQLADSDERCFCSNGSSQRRRGAQRDLRRSRRHHGRLFPAQSHVPSQVAEEENDRESHFVLLLIQSLLPTQHHDPSLST